jgi:hypothetical protein
MLPNICGAESIIAAAVRSAIERPLASGEGTVDLSRLRSAFAIALHMHQPLIPAGGADPRSAGLISNLRQMMQSTSDEQRHNGGIFRWCYQRMGEFIPQLIGEALQSSELDSPLMSESRGQCSRRRKPVCGGPLCVRPS